MKTIGEMIMTCQNDRKKKAHHFAVDKHHFIH